MIFVYRNIGTWYCQFYYLKSTTKHFIYNKLSITIFCQRHWKQPDKVHVAWLPHWKSATGANMSVIIGSRCSDLYYSSFFRRNSFQRIISNDSRFWPWNRWKLFLHGRNSRKVSFWINIHLNWSKFVIFDMTCTTCSTLRPVHVWRAPSRKHQFDNEYLLKFFEKLRRISWSFV